MFHFIIVSFIIWIVARTLLQGRAKSNANRAALARLVDRNGRPLA